jgi:hypothetical protein
MNIKHLRVGTKIKIVKDVNYFKENKNKLFWGEVVAIDREYVHVKWHNYKDRHGYNPCAYTKDSLSGDRYIEYFPKLKKHHEKVAISVLDL